MTTQEQACYLSSLRNNLNIICRKHSLSPPHLLPLQLWYRVPKNVSTPNRREKQQSRKLWEEDEKEGATSGGSSHGGSEGSPGQQKLHCVPVSPLHLLLTPCECATGRQVPRSPNNTSSHPENLPFQPQQHVSPRVRKDLRVQAETPINTGTLLCATRTARLLQSVPAPSRSHRDWGFCREVTSPSAKLETLTMMTRRMFWKSFLWPRA